MKIHSINLNYFNIHFETYVDNVDDTNLFVFYKDEKALQIMLISFFKSENSNENVNIVIKEHNKQYIHNLNVPVFLNCLHMKFYDFYFY